MKLSLLTISVLVSLTSSIIGQSENDSTGYNEVIRQTNPLSLKMLNNYPDYLIQNYSNTFYLPAYYGHQPNEIRSSLNLDMKRINSRLLNDFRQQMEWQKKQDMGILGQYLGYAMSAAAAGLAISHIVKYKEQAFIGK